MLQTLIAYADVVRDVVHVALNFLDRSSWG
jgi:hypothetical protein